VAEPSDRPAATKTIPAGPGNPPPLAHPTLVIAATVFGVLMDTVDVSAISVANPVIAVDLHTRLPDLQWATGGYVLAMAGLLVTAGKLGDAFGHRRMFFTGLSGFALASTLVGLAPTPSMLIGARVIQGAFGSLLVPTSLAILRIAFPDDQLKKAVGIWGGALALGGAAGPFVSGIVVDFLGWRWVFFLNLLIAAGALTIGALVIPRTPADRGARSFDIPGILLLGAALGALVAGIIQVPQDGWTSPRVLLLLCAAVVLATAFIGWEMVARTPLLPLGIFKIHALSAATGILVLTGLAMSGTIFYLALYLQEVRGLTPLEAGVTLIPTMALFSIGAPAGASLNQRFGPRLPIITGLVLIATAMFGLSWVSPGSPIQTIWPLLAPLGLGVGFTAPTATVVILSSAPVRLAGVAAGLQQDAAMIGAALGTATFGTVLSLTVGRVLGGHLVAAGLSPTTVDQVGERTGEIAQGVVNVPPALSRPQARAVVAAGHTAFTDGMHYAMLTGVVMVLAAILIAALFVTRPATNGVAERPRPTSGAGA
jgi:EmrB/QacA subfamily drug resistance transporter